jgi:hypothetical protein
MNALLSSSQSFLRRVQSSQMGYMVMAVKRVAASFALPLGVKPDAEVFQRSSRADHFDRVGAVHDLYSSNLRSEVQTSAQH